MNISNASNESIAEGFIVNTLPSYVSTMAEDLSSWCWECYLNSWQHIAYLKLMVYVPPILMIVGTGGNILNLIVLQSKHYKDSTTTVALSMLALMDIVVLWTGLLRLWLVAAWSVDIRVVHTIVCKLQFYISYMSVVLSTNVLALATIERAVSVCFPFKVKEWITKRRMILIIAILAFCMFVLYIPIPLEVHISLRSDGALVCNYFDSPLQSVWVWVDLVVTVFLPFSIIFFCNVIIIYKLRKSLRKRKGMTGGEDMHSSKTSQINSTSKMLVAISVAFFVTMTPVNVFYAGLEFNWFPRQTEKDWAIFDFTYAITHVLMYINNVLNFFLYCLTGSRFRTIFLETFRFKIYQRKPSTSDSNPQAINSTIKSDFVTEMSVITK